MSFPTDDDVATAARAITDQWQSVKGSPAALARVALETVAERFGFLEDQIHQMQTRHQAEADAWAIRERELRRELQAEADRKYPCSDCPREKYVGLDLAFGLGGKPIGVQRPYRLDRLTPEAVDNRIDQALQDHRITHHVEHPCDIEHLKQWCMGAIENAMHLHRSSDHADPDPVDEVRPEQPWSDPNYDVLGDMRKWSSPAGRCGASCDAMTGAPKVCCSLPAGHEGWHRDRSIGAEWSP